MIRRVWALGCGLAVLTTAMQGGPATAAAPFDDPESTIAAMRAQSRLTPSLHAVPGAATPVQSGMSAFATPSGYWVFDTREDAWGDSATTPELIGAGLAVSKRRPTSMLVSGLSDSGTYSTDTFGVLLDVTGDGLTDFGAVTTGWLALEQVYSMPLFRDVNGDLVEMNRSVFVIRFDDGYVIEIPGWRSLGMLNVSYVAGLGDDIDTDFAPDDYGTPVAVGALVPTVTAAPAKVGGLQVNPARKKATVSWRTTPRAASYRVRVSGSSNLGTWTNTNRTTAKAKGLKPGKRYTVKLRAVNAIGQGPQSSKKFRTDD